LPHAIHITTANVTDRKGAEEAVEANRVKKILADGGYTGENFSNKVKKLISAEIQNIAETMGC